MKRLIFSLLLAVTLFAVPATVHGANVRLCNFSPKPRLVRDITLEYDLSDHSYSSFVWQNSYWNDIQIFIDKTQPIEITRATSGSPTIVKGAPNLKRYNVGVGNTTVQNGGVSSLATDQTTDYSLQALNEDQVRSCVAQAINVTSPDVGNVSNDIYWIPPKPEPVISEPVIVNPTRYELIGRAAGILLSFGLGAYAIYLMRYRA